jgi:diguanylate cyclase (GGDEF)-like protein
MLRAACFIVVLYGLVVWRLSSQNPDTFDLRIGLAQWSVLAIVLLWFAVMGGYLNALLNRLGQSEVDELTGAYTRRRIVEILRHEKFRADRGAGPLCICLLDLDKLKQVNDTQGHQSGDNQLKMVVAAVQQELRNVDYLGRYGGDEFLAVLTQTSLAGAKDCAARFCRRLQALSSTQASAGLGATVSIGIAQYRPGESMTRTVERADRALYRAKNEGRNRIECEEPQVQHAD